MSTEQPIRHTEHFQLTGKRENVGKRTVRAKHLQHDAPVHSTSLISAFYLPAAGLSSYKNEPELHVELRLCVTSLKLFKYPNKLSECSLLKSTHPRRQQASKSKKYSTHRRTPFDFCVPNVTHQTSDLIWKWWGRWLHICVCVCVRERECCNPCVADRAQPVHFSFSSTCENTSGTQPGFHCSILQSNTDF